jgi:two-component system, chemotaxis family, chemotaxis protein CheY
MAVRALIADDSIFIRDVIRRHLERIGCEVVAEAENAAQALSLFRTVHPDMVTLDIVMAEVDGIDTLSAFQTMRKEAPDVPLVVVSAMPFDESKDTFLKSGALEYIVKPFSSAAFEQLRHKLWSIFPELKPGHSGAASANSHAIGRRA